MRYANRVEDRTEGKDSKRRDRIYNDVTVEITPDSEICSDEELPEECKCLYHKRNARRRHEYSKQPVFQQMPQSLKAYELPNHQNTDVLLYLAWPQAQGSGERVPTELESMCDLLHYKRDTLSDYLDD